MDPVTLSLDPKSAAYQGLSVEPVLTQIKARLATVFRDARCDQVWSQKGWDTATLTIEADHHITFHCQQDVGETKVQMIWDEAKDCLQINGQNIDSDLLEKIQKLGRLANKDPIQILQYPGAFVASDQCGVWRNKISLAADVATIGLVSYDLAINQSPVAPNLMGPIIDQPWTQFVRCIPFLGTLVLSILRIVQAYYTYKSAINNVEKINAVLWLLVGLLVILCDVGFGLDSLNVDIVNYSSGVFQMNWKLYSLLLGVLFYGGFTIDSYLMIKSANSKISEIETLNKNADPIPSQWLTKRPTKNELWQWMRKDLERAELLEKMRNDISAKLHDEKADQVREREKIDRILFETIMADLGLSESNIDEKQRLAIVEAKIGEWKQVKFLGWMCLVGNILGALTDFVNWGKYALLISTGILAIGDCDWIWINDDFRKVDSGKYKAKLVEESLQRQETAPIPA